MVKPLAGVAPSLAPCLRHGPSGPATFLSALGSQTSVSSLISTTRDVRAADQRVSLWGALLLGPPRSPGAHPPGPLGAAALQGALGGPAGLGCLCLRSGCLCRLPRL